MQDIVANKVARQILFYVEPLVERENPTWHTGWINNFIKRVAVTLLSEGIAEEDFACLLPTALAEAAGKILPRSRVVSIDQTELVPQFGRSALEIATAWYKNTMSDAQFSDMAALVKERLGDFVPTCCICFAPAPYLKAAWPDTHVLHMEYGLISRQPFPETVFFDPNGMFTDGTLASFINELRDRVPSTDERGLLNTIREDFCIPSCEKLNPLASLMASALVRFESAVLLALQFSNFYAYDAHARFDDQYDLLVHTLDAVPSSIAVVVCEHPEHLVLNFETIAYLESRYPNFIWYPLFRHICNASYYLMPFVQGVVTVSSSVGLQALLWEKHLAVLGDGYLAAVSDTCNVSELIPLLGSTWSEKQDRILCWLLSSFHLPFEALLSSGRLYQYFMALDSRALDKIENARDRLGIDIAELRQFYSSAWENRPMSPSGVLETPDETCFYAALYVASKGRSYDEHTCVRQFVSELDSEDICLSFILERENIEPLSVRFDPINRTGVLQVYELALFDARGAMLWEFGKEHKGVRSAKRVSIYDNDQGWLLVCQDDPQIELDIDFSMYQEAVRPLVIRARLKLEDFLAVELDLAKRNEIIAGLNQKVTARDKQIASVNQTVDKRDKQIAHINQTVDERDKQIAHINQTVDERDKQIAHINQTVDKLDKEIKSILSSRSWRLTAPLRAAWTFLFR